MNEEQFSPWRESKDNEEKPVRNRFESVVDFLRQSREKSDAEEDDDTDKVLRRKKAKSSPWRRFMRGLFGGEREEDDSKDAPSTVRRPVPSEPIKEVAADFDSIENTDSKNQPKSGEKAKDNDSQQQELNVTSPPQNEEKSVKTEERQHSEREYEQTPAQKKPVTEKIIPKQSHETNPSDQKHSNPTGLLLGLDYLNYRGRKKLDKKVEKQHRKQDESLNSLKEQLQNQQEKHNQLPRQENKPSQKNVFEVRQENSDTLKEPEVQVVFNHQETRGDAPEYDMKKVKQEKQRTQEELQKLIELRKKQEQQLKIAREQSVEREKLERYKQNIDNQEKLSKELFETESTFVEKEHERKNEVRDQPQRLQPAVSVGAVLGNMQVKKYSQPEGKDTVKASTITQLQQGARKRDEQMADLETTNIYKYAVKTGFMTALLLMAIILSIAILR